MTLAERTAIANKLSSAASDIAVKLFQDPNYETQLHTDIGILVSMHFEEQKVTPTAFDLEDITRIVTKVADKFQSWHPLYLRG